MNDCMHIRIFFYQAEDGIRDVAVTGVQTCALPIAIDSLVELLQGRFSKGVMERICRENNGLFPSPKEIQFSCSCPDWAYMRKHVAAVLYGIGARLDRQPELLFRLHKLDEKELISSAGRELPLARKGGDSGKILSTGDLSELFGLDLAKSGARSSPLSSTRASQNKSAKEMRGRKQVVRPGGRQRSG